MKRLWKCLWQDEHGVILSTEIVIVGSVLVIGLITGMSCLQEAVNGEMKDLAGAIGSLDQSYSFAGQVGDKRCPVCTAGSSYRDCEEQCEEDQGDIAAASCYRGAIPCQTGCCGDAACGSCGSCGSSNGCSGCGSYGGAGFGYQPKARCVSTGVPNMKVTEWPLTGDACDQCIPPKKPFINIPDDVW